MRRWRWTSRAAPERRTIRCGDCRCGRPSIAGSIRRSPTSTMGRRARLPAPSPARCSCSVSSRTRKAGCISISTAGRRRRSRRGPRAANARPHARSTNCSGNAMDDPRLTPARPDLAAKYLEGKIEAARFVVGEEFEIIDSLAPLREGPSADAMLATQALKGERVTIYDRNGEGFAWGQLNSDGYVGWLPDSALAKPAVPPTHKIIAIRTFALPGPSTILPPVDTLVMGAMVTVLREQGAFAATREGWYLPRLHVSGIDRHAEDFVPVAQRFPPTPHLSPLKSIFG